MHAAERTLCGFRKAPHCTQTSITPHAMGSTYLMCQPDAVSAAIQEVRAKINQQQRRVDMSN